MYQLNALRSSAIFTGYWIAAVVANVLVFILMLLSGRTETIFVTVGVIIFSVVFLFFSVRTMKRSFARLTYTLKHNDVVDQALREFIRGETAKLTK